MFWSRYGGRVARHVVVGDLRVQQIERKDGRRSWTIVWPEGTVHAEADRFLRLHNGSGTQRTYAYLLVDHLSLPELVRVLTWCWHCSWFSFGPGS